jgi:S-adenosylmethionine decarboxylase
MTAQEILGSHYILDLCSCDNYLLNDVDHIMVSLREAIVQSNATLLEELKYEFTPQGVTVICLLSESHISIHTWPEKEYAAVDIFTCGDHTNPDKACDFMIDALKSKKPTMTIIKRGI